MPKFPEDGGEHGQGRFHPREAHLAEAGAVVTDEGHVHGAVCDRAGAAGDRTVICAVGNVWPQARSSQDARCPPHGLAGGFPHPGLGASPSACCSSLLGRVGSR